MTRRSVNETTAWCEAHIWSSMPDKETVYAYIVSAYHLRQDDAYAAVGMLRGQLKRQMPEYANDAWCDPETDFVRFVNAGAVRGALPRWWNAEHRRQAVHAQSLLGYGLLSSEEPVDFLRAFGPTEGAEAIKQLRDLGDIFEGPAAWERQTDRDQEEHRKPAIGRRESEQICHRCRAGVELPLWQGLYSFSCPYCQYSLPCPKCDAAIVDGHGALHAHSSLGCTSASTLAIRAWPSVPSSWRLHSSYRHCAGLPSATRPTCATRAIWHATSSASRR